MTGTQKRKQKIYERRVARRAAKKAERIKAFCNFYNVFSDENLYGGFLKIRPKLKKCADGIWYCVDAPINISYTGKKVRGHRYQFRPLRHKHIKQRGKPRTIGIGAAEDRVILSTLNEYCLKPMIEPTLINTCTAGRRDGGPEVAILQLEEGLKRYYRKHGCKGYALITDAQNCYGSIYRPILEQDCRRVIPDRRINMLIKDSNDAAIPGDVGINLGSSTSTMYAALYFSPIDHYAKEVLRLDYYRHGDDIIIIHHDKEFLLAVKDALQEKFAERRLTMHPKKTRIERIDKGFRWLKVKFRLTETGYVVKRMNPDIPTHDRKKFKKCRVLLDEGLTTKEYVDSQWENWKNKAKASDLVKRQKLRKGFKKKFRYDNYWIRNRMATVYFDLFAEWEGCSDVFYQIIADERRYRRSRAARVS